MTDELELLRQHDPAPPGQGPWRERELTPDAERRLNGLLHGARPRTWRRRVMVIGAASGALLVALTFTLSDAGSTPAAAVPVALQLRSAPSYRWRSWPGGWRRRRGPRVPTTGRAGAVICRAGT